MTDDTQNMDPGQAQATPEIPPAELVAPPLDAVQTPVPLSDSVPENSAPTMPGATSTEPVITDPSPVAQTPTPPPANPIWAAPAPTFDQKFSVNLGKWKEHLALAMAKRLEHKQARLNKLLALAQEQGTITNKQVKKTLRCTKLTAWRYLKTLEQQGRLRRIGGHNVTTYELVR